MGKIEVFSKWDLENNNWILKPNFEQHGRSFAMANYGEIINNSSNTVNYIIIAPGSRVEDHSKDFTNIKEKELRIDNVIKHYQSSRENYEIKAFLMDADAPIIEDAKMFARYVDKLAQRESTKTINIIGLSKCGAMSVYIPSFFRYKKTFEKTNMFNVAPPYTGTRLASPLFFYQDVEKLMKRVLGDNAFSDLVYRESIRFYESISSNSHMDYDIALVGGVPKEKSNVYDQSFIENIFRDDNISAIRQLNSFKNILTGIDENTLKEAIRTANVVGIGLCIMNDVFFEKKSDGMVMIDAQREIEKFLDINSFQLKSAHHDVGSNIRVFNDILGLVDDTIEEVNEKRLVNIRKF